MKLKKRRTRNQIDNWDSILEKFKYEKPVKCRKCESIIKLPIESSYAHPNIFCKKCFKKTNKSDLKSLDKLKKII